MPQSRAHQSALRIRSSELWVANASGQPRPFGGGGTGAKDGEAGRGKREGADGCAAGATSVSPGLSGVGSAVDTTRSSPPVISSQKHGPPVGSVWCPPRPAAWCAAWWWHASSARVVAPPGPAASQQAAASVKRISRGVLRIVPSVRPQFRLAQPRPGRVDCLAMGERIEYRDGRWVVPKHPIIPFIEGDGTGPDIWRAARRVFDAVVEKISRGTRRIDWLEVLAGEKAFKQVGNWLPEATLDAIRTHRVAIKGPLTTPVGGGIRSLNVALRQVLDLYACIRPVRYFEGVPSPVREPQKLDVVIFRENTEDVYAGIEWPAGSEGANQIVEFVNNIERRSSKIREGSAVGIKPVS